MRGQFGHAIFRHNVAVKLIVIDTTFDKALETFLGCRLAHTPYVVKILGPIRLYRQKRPVF